MNRFCKLIVSFITFLIFASESHSQLDPQFSQFYASSIYLNPAMSGLEHNLAVGALYRTQWIGLNPYQVGLVNVIMPYHDKGEKNYHKGGIGANLWSARAGDGQINSLGASLNAAYNLHIAATTAQNLTFGLQIGFIQRQFNNLNSYQWGSQYNPGIGFDGSQNVDGNFNQSLQPKIYPDVAAGVLYYYNAGRDVYAPGISAYIGLVGAHLNQPNESIVPGQTYKVPIHIRVHGGIEVHMAKRLNMSPNFLFINQATANFAMTGLSFTYLFPDHDDFAKPTRLVLGGAYRFGNAVVGQVGFGSKYYSLGFSYDLGAGGLSSAYGQPVSAYEISFKTSIHIGQRAKKSSKFHTPLM